MPAFFDSLPARYAILLTGPKSVDKSALCIDLMKYYIDRGEKVIYMSTDSTPERVKRLFMWRGMDVSRHSESFIIIDCFTPWAAINRTDDPEYAMSTQPDVDALKVGIRKATTRLGGKVHIFVDTASSVFLHNGNAASLDFISNICEMAGREYDSVMLIMHEGIHDPKTVEVIRAKTNGLIETRSDEDLNTFLRYIPLPDSGSNLPWQKFVISEMGVSFGNGTR